MDTQKAYKINEIKDQKDLTYALGIRAIVFIDEQNCPFDEEFDDYDRLETSNVIHFIVKHDKKPLATARVIYHDKTQVKIGRIAVLKTFRGKGIGTHLLSHIMKTLISQNYTDISINAQQHLEAFYRSLGFQTSSDVFDEAGIPHIQMYYQSRSND